MPNRSKHGSFGAADIKHSGREWEIGFLDNKISNVFCTPINAVLQNISMRRKIYLAVHRPVLFPVEFIEIRTRQNGVCRYKATNVASDCADTHSVPIDGRETGERGPVAQGALRPLLIS